MLNFTKKKALVIVTRTFISKNKRSLTYCKVTSILKPGKKKPRFNWDKVKIILDAIITIGGMIILLGQIAFS